MVTCKNCGSTERNQADKCSNCGSFINLPPHMQKYLESDDVGLFPNDQHVWMDDRGYGAIYRSDGGKFLGWAWVCASIALICFFASMVIPTRDIMGNIDPGGIGSRFYAALLGTSFASLWGILFGIGHIVRAIYFLPGNAMKPRADTAIIRAKKSARARIEGAPSKA